MPDKKESVDLLSRDDVTTLVSHYVHNLYTKVRAQQEIDLTYINDTFVVDEIADPHTLYRSGIGDRIVNAPAEHIVTENPQVFFIPKKPTKANIRSAEKMSEVVNEFWIPLIKRQNPNIFKEFIKNLLGRGESFFKVLPNPRYEYGDPLPVNFTVPDSMVIYASPSESIEGVPDRVVVYYDISQYRDLIPRYPMLENVQWDANEQITWIEYYDHKIRYAEAGAVALTASGEVQEHIYGSTPFVRKYSGFGRRSPDGELASLIVSDIRRSRDLVREECATRSNIASIEYLFAHSPYTFIGKGLVAEDIRENISFGAYDINALDADPKDVRIEKLEIEPSEETYIHHATIISELHQRHPFILAGAPLGSSGRQQDMTALSGMRRYDSVVENTENAFATALKLAFKQCCRPGFIPHGLTEADLKVDYEIKVKLKAKDPLVEDRRITMGNRLWNGGNGSISLRTFHVDYQQMTVDQSNREIARVLAERITIFNPEIAAVLGMVAAEETGMEDWLEKARMRNQVMEKARGLVDQPTASQQTRTQGEVETEECFEESNQRGARNPPAAFNRTG